MKYILLTCAFVMLLGETMAQTSTHPINKTKTTQQKKKNETVRLKNTVFIEIGGVGISTLNYQRNSSLSKRIDLAVGVAVNPFSFTYGASGSKKFSPSAAILCQGIYKFRKNELGLGCGLRSEITYDPQATTNIELTRAIKHTFVAQLGYGRLFGKHIYSGLYTYLFVGDEPELLPGVGFKIGYRFGKQYR